jgi:glycosyltransferase involved in cell wall biosynthesis
MLGMSWIAIQLGSREHYAIPLALYSVNQLEAFVTDAWVTGNQSALAKNIFPSLALRRNSDLPDVLVKRRTLARLAIDGRIKLKQLNPWQAILYRNHWFQRWAEQEVAAAASRTIFSYSYTARLPFMAAKRRGALCILGQIDPGPIEHEIVEQRSAGYRNLAPSANHTPAVYWAQWREEIALADRIVVNSPWSAQLLQAAGVPVNKLVEIPLVYSPCPHSSGSSLPSPQRTPPVPLQALFLGSVILRKGVGQLFEAMKILKKAPVEFTIAGPIMVKIPDEIFSLANARFLGPVDQKTAEGLYQASDIFLFPTLSDGFGLTQLEALGHGLPVIASTNCARVIVDCVNGLVLKDVTPETIAEAIMKLVGDPYLLARLQANASVPDRFHPRHLAPALLALTPQ